MTDCPDLRTRILAAISSVPCDRCRQRPDYKPSDCEKHTCRQMYEQEAYAVMSVIDEILRLRAENEKLKQDLEVAMKHVASAHETSKMAWGGEIPSPLPGHPSMTEDEVCAMFEHLNCPWCGGSGHVGDCDEADRQVKAKLERLEKEADWLSLHLEDTSIGRCSFCRELRACTTKDTCAKTWRDLAREAVERETCPKN